MSEQRDWIDISQPVGPDSGVFAGDTKFRYSWKWDQRRGASCNVAAIETSPHVGTHADAPLHFRLGGTSIGEVDLEPFLGPCIVIEGPVDGMVQQSHLRNIDLAATPRVLLKTHSRLDTAFPDRFVALSVEAAEYLGARGCRLIGLDTPSVDPAASKSMEAHHALGRRNVAILENLQLAHVSAGRYELIALPLRWIGLDAAPVRAILRPLRA
jgi:arylformamidase